MKNLYTTLAFLCLIMWSPLTILAQCGLSNINTTNDLTTVFTCPQDGNPDLVSFTNTNTSGSQYAYAITDNDNTILTVITDASFDFDPAPPGNCLVWGFSYTGQIMAIPGESVFTTQFSDGCWLISRNAISVVRQSPDGGAVSTPTGSTSEYVCLADGIADFVGFTNTSASTANYQYVITDDNNNILGLPNQAFLDFSGAGVGICRVWGLSYTGNLTANVGDNAAAISLSDGCFDLSDNFITVFRNEVDGGQVSTSSGDAFVDICTLDGNPDIINFSHTTSSSANYAYAITDESNIILTITTDSAFDFDVAPAGTCRVWGFSYTGNILAQAGASVFTTQFSEGCWEISATAITVIRRSVDGGTVAMPSGATTRYTCPSDGTPDIVMFTNTSTAAANFAYVITDDQNNILGLPPSNSQDFEGAGVGICRVWGLSYLGNLTAQIGDNAAEIALSDDCFDLSDNFITIVRDNPNGGTVQTVDGATTVNLCAGDGIDDIIEFAHTTSSNAAYAYVITDDQNNILGLPNGNSQNFEGAGNGVCRVWGLSYTGTIAAQIGDNAATIALSSDCFDLSTNFITVNRTGVDGGEILTVSGETVVYTCPNDGVDDVYAFEIFSNESATLQIVVTDEDLNILGLPPANMVNFEGAGVGTCLVWALSYTGDLLIAMGDNVGTIGDLSDGCFDLSDNFVTVNRDEVNGGLVQTLDGETAVSTIAGDGIDDIISFVSIGTSNSNFTYVITDDQNNILGIPSSNSQNFEGAGAGVCRVWGLSYTGELTAQIGDDAAAVALSDDCFDLSDNFIEVIRTEMTSNLVQMDAQIFPNPVINDARINFNIKAKMQEAETTIFVYTLTGNLVHQGVYYTVEGENDLSLAIGHLQEGLYKVTIQNGTNMQNLTFVKQ